MGHQFESNIVLNLAFIIFFKHFIQTTKLTRNRGHKTTFSDFGSIWNYFITDRKMVSNATDSSQNKTRPAEKHRLMYVNLLLSSNQVDLTPVALYVVISVEWYHSNRLCRSLEQSTNGGKLLQSFLRKVTKVSITAILNWNNDFSSPQLAVSALCRQHTGELGPWNHERSFSKRSQKLNGEVTLGVTYLMCSLSRRVQFHLLSGVWAIRAWPIVDV